MSCVLVPELLWSLAEISAPETSSLPPPVLHTHTQIKGLEVFFPNSVKIASSDILTSENIFNKYNIIIQNLFRLTNASILTPQTCRTFFKRLVNPNLSLGEVLVVLQVWENPALVDPVVIVRPEEKDWEIADVMFQVLDVGRNQPRVTDLSGPPSTHTKKSQQI